MGQEKQDKDGFLYEYAYQILLRQIEMGIVKKGECLLTKSEICQQYHIGIRPVWVAVEQLGADGLVRLERSKPAVVLYQGNNRAALQMLKQRFTMNQDVLAGCQLLVVPLLIQGAALGSAADFERILQDCEDYAPRIKNGDYFHPILALVNSTTQKLNNMTWQDMWLELLFSAWVPYLTPALSRGLGGPYCYSAQAYRSFFHNMVNLMKQGLWAKSAGHIYAALDRAEAEVIQLAGRFEPADPETLARYRWRMARGRQKLGGQVTAQIMAKIYWGEYLPGAYLPKFPQLRETYGVSDITLREMVTILKELGLVKQFPKQGYCVIYGQRRETPLRFTNRILKENLALFLGALQILTITAPLVAWRAFLTLPAAAGAGLSGDDAALGQGAVRELLLTLSGHLQNQCLADTYQQLMGFLNWGIFLRNCVEDAFAETVRRRYQAVLGALAAGNRLTFFQEMAGLMLCLYHFAWDELAKTNLEPEAFPDRLSAGLIEYWAMEK